MPKTAAFTTVTPLPAGITRKSVMEMYEDHMAMIDLNPLVVERFRCRPPSYAPSDEYFATWYTIKDKVSYLPGGFAQGSVSYHACFHDTPEGLKTHVYAPLGLDIRGKWSVGGSLPGEPKHTPEKGVKAPRHGLYIREDVTMTCSSLLMGFVKRTFKDSHASLVEKLVERAHLLESNFANERLRALRNVSPGERMATGDIFIAPPPDYRPWGYISPCPESPDLPSPSPRFAPFSAPAPSPLHRTLTVSERSPQHTSLSPHSTHSRSHSDPIASPGFSSSSTLVNDSDRPPTPPKETLQLPLIAQPAASAPLANLYLLPATTYDGGRTDRLISLHPGGCINTHSRSQSDVSFNGHSRSQSDVSFNALKISCDSQERPISFTISRTSAFDTKSRTSTTSSNQNILDEIDDAIDQVFLFTAPNEESTQSKEKQDREKEYEEGEMLILPATKYESPIWKEVVLPKKRYEPAAKSQELLLPATKYEPEPKQVEQKQVIEPKPVVEQKKPVLPSTTYTPQRARKDSVVPWTDKELPPVPIDG